MNNALPTDYQSFIHTSRYARWIEEENREARNKIKGEGDNR